MSIAQLNPSVQSSPTETGRTYLVQQCQGYLAERAIPEQWAKDNKVIYCPPHKTFNLMEGGDRKYPSIGFKYEDPLQGNLLGFRCRIVGDNYPKDPKTGKDIKCVQRRGTSSLLYFPPAIDYSTLLADPNVDLVLIEGEGKTLSISWQLINAGHNIVTAGITGCWNWGKKVGEGKYKLNPSFNSINLQGKKVIFIADSDIYTNRKVRKGIRALCETLIAAGAILFIIVAPQTSEKQKGMDDFIADPNHDGPAKFLELYNNPVAYAEWVLSLEDQFKPTGKGKNGEDDPEDIEIITEILNRPNISYWINEDDDSQYFCDITLDNITETVDFTDRKSIIRDYIISEFIGAKDGKVSPSMGTIANAQADQRHKLRRTAPRYKVETRIQMWVDPDGNIEIYYDLGDPDWNILKVSKNGRVVIPYSECPVKFKRTPLTKAVQISDVAAILDELREVFNLDDHSLILLVASMMSVFIPDMTKPILNVVGPKGSGKTTMMERVIEIVDPVKVVPLLSELPEKVQDLMIAGQSRQVLAYDNLSKLTEKQSNTLSTIATGAGFVARKLYSNDEEVALSLTRLQAITSVDDTISRSDLASRAFRIDFNTTINSGRKSKAQLDKIAKDLNPRIRAYLFDGLAAALRNDYQNIDVSGVETRFLDLAQLMAGAEVALGFPPGAFAEAVAVNKGIIQQAVDDANPALSAFLAAMEDRPRRRETASGWVGILQKHSDDPAVEGLRSPALGKMLAGSLGADLRDRGFRVELIKRSDNNYWDIRKSPELLPPHPPQPPYPSQGKDSSDGSNMEDGSKMEAATADLAGAVATNEMADQPREPMEARTSHPPSSIHPPSSKPLPSKGYGSYGSNGSKSSKVNSQEIDQLPLPLANPFKVGDPVEDPTIPMVGEVIDVLGDMVLVQWEPSDPDSTTLYHFLEVYRP